MTFDHRDDGTPESAWAEARPWRDAAPLDLSDVGSVLVVAAHPDDETLGAGGLLAAAARLGIRTAVVVASDGEGSHPESPTTDRDSLVVTRRAEVGHAVRTLAPDAGLHLLGLPDGHLEEHAAALDVGLADALGDGAALGGGAAEEREGVTLVVGTWADDGHPDHTAVARAVARLAEEHAEGIRALAMPIWAWHWSQPDRDDLPWSRALVLRLDADARRTKAEALAHHVSQNEPLSPAPGDEAILSAGFRAHFDRDVEVFLPVGAAAEGDARPAAGRSGTGAPGASLAEGYFRDFYGDRDDPWGFEDRWYEERKRAITLGSLPRPRFGRVLELGCSIGVLTELLAERSDRLLAVDIAEAAVEKARRRLAGRDHVEVRRARLPEEWPDGDFDLIVISEVGYYLSVDDLHRLVDRVAGAAGPSTVVVTCHWRHPVDDYPLGGDDVATAFRERLGMPRTVAHEEADFLLDVFDREGISVAQRTGLAERSPAENGIDR